MLSLLHIFSSGKIKKDTLQYLFLVEEDGFEPSKSLITDLQSAPFGRSGIPPYLVLVVGLEPTTY